MTIKRGDSIQWEIVYKTDDGTPIDITGFHIKCQGRVSAYSSDYVFSVSTDDNITITDAINGQFTIKILDTSSIPIGKYKCDIQYTTVGGFISSSNTFTLEVLGDITR